MMNAHDAGDAGDRHGAQGRRSAAGPPPARPAPVQDFRDAWFIGYTGHLVTGVWLGNDDNSPTNKATGGGMPVDIWSRFMKPAHQGVAGRRLAGLRRAGRAPRDCCHRSGWRASTARTRRAAAADAARADAQPEAGSIDSWLLDRLFGRR